MKRRFRLPAKMLCIVAVFVGAEPSAATDVSGDITNDVTWTGGGDDSLLVIGNLLRDGYDDAIDINFSPARVTGNIISNFVDKAISLGLGGNAPANRTYGETAVIDNNLFLRCDMGIAIKDQSRPLVRNNTIIGCSVGVASYDKIDGPGFGSVSNTVIWDCGTSIELHNCVVTDNSATGNGGGLYISESGRAESCQVSNNTTVIDGGGVYLRSGGEVVSCGILDNKSTTDDGGGVRCRNGGTLLNSIIAYNDAPLLPNHRNEGSFVASYCNSTPLLPGTGNTTNDPAFHDVPGRDFRLLSDSPCIDAGLDQAWMASADDYWGQPRIMRERVDVGAHEVGLLYGSFTASPTSGYAPLPVVFSATVYGTNTSGLLYGWDFDDDGEVDAGGPGLGVVTNVYTDMGPHSVSLWVSNGVGEVALFARMNYILVGTSNLFVALDGGHQSPYGSWQTAATNLQSALAVAAGGSTVTVSNGVYALASEVVVGTDIVLQSLLGAEATVLDGQDSVRCLSGPRRPAEQLRGHRQQVAQRIGRCGWRALLRRWSGGRLSRDRQYGCG